MVVKKEDEMIYFEMEEIEEDMYEEFKAIVEEVSIGINEKILASDAFKPLDNILKRYESHIPKLTSSVGNIEKISKHFDKTKEDLYKNIEKTIGTVSNKVIQDTVLSKMDEVYKKYDNQLTSLGKRSNELESIFDGMKNIEKEILPTVSQAIMNSNERILKKEVLSKFDALYDKFTNQLPLMEKNNKVAKELTEKMEDVRKNIFEDISSNYEEISNKITAYITMELTGLYENFQQQLEVSGEKNENLENSLLRLTKLSEGAQGWHDKQLEKFEKAEQELEEIKKQNMHLKQQIEKNARTQLNILIGLGFINIVVLLGVFLYS